ncbi:hypothetical protein COBT_001044 [Conglomerata obtusa]
MILPYLLITAQTADIKYASDTLLENENMSVSNNWSAIQDKRLMFVFSLYQKNFYEVQKRLEKAFGFLKPWQKETNYIYVLKIEYNESCFAKENDFLVNLKKNIENVARKNNIKSAEDHEQLRKKLMLEDEEELLVDTNFRIIYQKMDFNLTTVYEKIKKKLQCYYPNKTNVTKSKAFMPKNVHDQSVILDSSEKLTCFEHKITVFSFIDICDNIDALCRYLVVYKTQKKIFNNQFIKCFFLMDNNTNNDFKYLDLLNSYVMLQQLNNEKGKTNTSIYDTEVRTKETNFNFHYNEQKLSITVKNNPAIENLNAFLRCNESITSILELNSDCLEKNDEFRASSSVVNSHNNLDIAENEYNDINEKFIEEVRSIRSENDDDQTNYDHVQILVDTDTNDTDYNVNPAMITHGVIFEDEIIVDLPETFTISYVVDELELEHTNILTYTINENTASELTEDLSVSYGFDSSSINEEGYDDIESLSLSILPSIISRIDDTESQNSDYTFESDLDVEE